MKKTRNLVSIFALTLLCILCIVCIISLNKEENNTNIEVDDYETQVYSAYSKIILSRQDIRKTEKIDGIIKNASDNIYEELQYIGSKKDMKVFQGEKFHTGNLIYGTSKSIYKAKFDGIVDRVTTNGNKVNVVLVNYENRYIETDIPIELLKYLKLNKKIEFIYASKIYKGKISYISNVAENDCVKVEIKFADDNFKIVTNSNVKVIIQKAVAKSVLAVPKGALIKSGSEYYLRVENGSESGELVKVNIGLESDNGDVEIVSGVTEDDIVMVDMNVDLYDTEPNDEK